MYDVEFFGGDLSLTVNKIAFSIGNFDIYWYGVIIACGMLAAILYAFLRSDEFGIKFDRMVDVIFVGLIGAVLCARIYYVVMSPGSISSIGDFFNLHSGGIAIYGAIIGALLFGGIMCKIRKINVLSMFDLASVGFLLGQSVGRWGNFMNQEAFGCNTDLPWGMWSTEVYNYLSAHKSSLAAEGITVNPAMPVHPCFLYESLWCLIGFVLLHFLSRRRRYNGQVLLWYIVWYGAGRAVIEGLRTDSLMIGPIRASQALAIVCVIAGIAALIIFGKKYKDRPVGSDVVRVYGGCAGSALAEEKSVSVKAADVAGIDETAAESVTEGLTDEDPAKDQDAPDSSGGDPSDENK